MRVRTILVTLAFVVMGLSGCFSDSSDVAVNATFTVTQSGNSTYLFDASNSTGDIVEYQWNFGEGTLVNTTKRKAEMEYTITDARPTVSLVVVAADGSRAFNMTSVTLGSGQNVAPEVRLDTNPRWVAPGAEVVLDASGSEDPDGDGFTSEWYFGPVVDPRPAEATFDTGGLEEGDSFDQTFDTVGTYFFQCEPHPWMTGRVVVSDNATTSTNATLEIENFAFNGGEDFLVRPGTTMTIHNLDPVVHTATAYAAAPGAVKQPTDARTLRLSGLEADDYAATLVLDDKKPGVPSVESWAVKVSADAPAINFSSPVYGGDLTTFNDGAQTEAFPATLEYEANITAEATYSTSPTGATVSFQIVGSNTTVPGACAAGSCVAIGDLPPAGDYEFQFEVTDGAVTEWQVEVKRFIYYTAPDFDV